jgi:hypothetical protein
MVKVLCRDYAHAITQRHEMNFKSFAPSCLLLSGVGECDSVDLAAAFHMMKESKPQAVVMARMLCMSPGKRHLLHTAFMPVHFIFRQSRSHEHCRRGRSQQVCEAAPRSGSEPCSSRTWSRMGLSDQRSGAYPQQSRSAILIVVRLQNDEHVLVVIRCVEP